MGEGLPVPDSASSHAEGACPDHLRSKIPPGFGSERRPGVAGEHPAEIIAESLKGICAADDGDHAVQTAADWFNGREIPPVEYLPKHIITKLPVRTVFFLTDSGCAI